MKTMLPRPRREDAGAGAGDDDGEGGAGDSQNCLKKERRWCGWWSLCKEKKKWRPSFEKEKTGRRDGCVKRGKKIGV